jgi:asparagine synthase (glutamine-hydrolysing)
MGYFWNVSVVADALHKTLFSQQLRRTLNGYHASEVLSRYAKNAPTDDPVTLAQYIDLKTWLPGDILTKVDRASMYRSLEVRVPFLANAMLDYAQSLGPRDCINGRQGKYNLKSALTKLTNSELPMQPKRGFDIPIGDWLRGPLRKDVEDKCLQMPSELGHLISVKVVRKLLDAHMNKGQEWGGMVWALYALVNWHACHRRSFQRN